METTINTRQVMEMVGMDIGMIGMGVLVGMAQPSGNSVGVAFS